jgi:hypothetical protein
MKLQAPSALLAALPLRAFATTSADAMRMSGGRGGIGGPTGYPAISQGRPVYTSPQPQGPRPNSPRLIPSGPMLTRVKICFRETKTPHTPYGDRLRISYHCRYE